MCDLRRNYRKTDMKMETLTQKLTRKLKDTLRKQRKNDSFGNLIKSIFVLQKIILKKSLSNH